MPRESTDHLIAESEKLRADLKRTAARLLAFSEELAAEVQALREAGEGDDEGTGSGAAGETGGAGR